VPSVFLEGASRPLLVLHALVAAALVGASTHQAVVSVQLVRGRLHLRRLARTYAWIVAATFAASFALGLLMYPAFRFKVRGLYLDRNAPWASNLFDFKEALAALALPLVVALFFVGRRIEPQSDRGLLPLHAALALSLWAMLAFALVSGLLVTSVRAG
jgi:hypothetical protein